MDKSFKGLFDAGDDGEDEQDRSRGNVSNFMRDFGWIYQTELVAKYERIKVSDAYELSTINYLNDLSYLKAKSEYESEQLKKAYGKKS